jgi:PAS domain S-box-containing protein
LPTSKESSKTQPFEQVIAKHKQAKLDKSTEIYRAIVETTQEGILVTDLEGKITFANEHIADSLGYTIEELVGRSGLDLVVESEKPSAQERMEKRQEGIKEQYEIWMRKKGSGKVCFLASGSPILNPQGQHTGNLGMYVDITERKKAEEALRKSEERFRTVFEKTALGIVIGDMEGHVVESNSALQRMLGYDEDELKGKLFSEFTYPDEINLEWPLIRDLVAGKCDKYEIEKRYIRKDGEIIWVHLTGNIIFGRNKEPLIGVATIEDITERKKVEEDLRKSEARLRLIAQAGRIGFFEYNASKDIAYWSPEHYELLGYESGSVISWNRWLQGVHPEDRERIIANAARLMERGRSEGHVEGYKDEYRFIRPDGSIVWIESDLSLNVVNNETIIRGSIRNITKRKKTEEALKQSQKLTSNQLEEIKSYYDNAPVGLAILDRDMRYIRVNNRFAEMDGMPAEEHVGKTVREVVPTLAEQAEELPRKIIKSGEAVRNIEFSGETASCPGEKRTWLESWIPIKDLLGEVTSLYVMAEDVTERKKAEEAVKESEFLYRTLFDNTEDGFALVEPIFDDNGESDDYWIIQVNKTWERQTGTEATFIEGKRIREVMPNTEPVWAAKYAKIVKTGKADHFEEYNQFTDRWYDVYAFAYKQGQVGLLFRDVTARKEMEKHIQDKERLAAIGATAGMVGHDIRNPLQAITGDIYLVKTELAELSDSAQKKNALESLDEIQSDIDYINKIVVDLQDYARPLNPRAQQTDLTSVFKEMMAKNAIPKNVKVTVDVEDKARHVMADADFLKRIVGNLTLNAVQAMPDGGKLTICACLDKQTNDTLITVKDTGVGIPEDIKPKLFTPMMTTKSKGQGFGLAVVKRMTEGLGGTVTFESQEGKGTKFIVRLPPSQELDGKWAFK